MTHMSFVWFGLLFTFFSFFLFRELIIPSDTKDISWADNTMSPQSSQRKLLREVRTHMNIDSLLEHGAYPYWYPLCEICSNGTLFDMHRSFSVKIKPAMDNNPVKFHCNKERKYDT
jgi:hypothetical protein